MFAIYCLIYSCVSSSFTKPTSKSNFNYLLLMKIMLQDEDDLLYITRYFIIQLNRP